MKTEIREVDGRGILLSFNKKIYPEESIKKAVIAFKGCCALEYLNGEVSITEPEGENAKLIAYEFFNYLVALKQNEN